jgi:RNA polymerase sigma-70 factor (ECF subfamily)
MIEAAAKGSQPEREAFARHYLDVVRSYLMARWGGSSLRQSIDDAVQDVFVECFRHDGPLARADRSRGGGFRPFLFGVVRNIARRIESRDFARVKAVQSGVDLAGINCDDTHLSHVFDRAWARSIMRQAADLQTERARQAGDAAMRRVELLRLRFREGLPIRKISRLWDEDASKLHHDYAQARREFKAALKQIVAFHYPGSPEVIERECANLLELVK